MDYKSTIGNERADTGDESLNTPPPPPGQNGPPRSTFWGKANITACMHNTAAAPETWTDADGCPVIPSSPAEAVGNALPGHLRKAYFENLRGDPNARAAAEDLATRASMTVLRESLPGILAEAIKLAKR